MYSPLVRQHQVLFDRKKSVITELQYLTIYIPSLRQQSVAEHECRQQGNDHDGYEVAQLGTVLTGM